jgi:hypothetical protein
MLRKVYWEVVHKEAASDTGIFALISGLSRMGSRQKNHGAAPGLLIQVFRC